MTFSSFASRSAPFIVAAALLCGTLAAPASAQTASAQPKGSATQEYLQRAGMGDLFEVQSSKLALERAKSPDIKAFANMMIRDHTASTKMLGDAAQSQKIAVTPPTKLDAAHQEKFDMLQKAGAAKFESEYLKVQMDAHDEGLSLHRAYAKGGDNAAIKKVAAEIVKTVEHHREEAMKLAAQSK